MKGLFLMGQNPAAGAPNARLNRAALRQLDWLVVRDFFLIESATFWKDGPDKPDPTTIGTEVFFLPAAAGAGEAGLADQHAAPAAVAREGRRSAGRLPLRPVVHLEPGPPPEGALRRQHRRRATRAC